MPIRQSRRIASPRRQRGQRAQEHPTLKQSKPITDSEPQNHRRFTVADALLLVGAAAVGFALVRQWRDPHWALYPMQLAFYPQQGPSFARRMHRTACLAVSWTIPFAIALTLTLLAARLRHPRPSFDRIAQQPGAVACATALLAMVLRYTQDALYYVLDYLTYASSPVRLPSPPFQRLTIQPRHSLGQAIQNILLESFPMQASPMVGVAVLVAWLVLLANRRWLPERDWVDRSGRTLGAYWIALAVFIAVMIELWKHID
jgi:hypothetical protein